MEIKILEEITGELRKKIIAIEDLKIGIIKLQMTENHQMKIKIMPITGQRISKKILLRIQRL